MEQNLDHHFSAESIFSEEKCQERITALTRLLHSPSEESLWNAIILFQGYPFRTVSGLPFSYTIKIGKNGQLTKELLINRRENSKSLTWSSICLAYKKALHTDEVVDRPKKLGDIRGISYIYPILWQFGLIKVPESSKIAMDNETPGNTSFSRSYDNNKIIG